MRSLAFWEPGVCYEMWSYECEYVMYEYEIARLCGMLWIGFADLMIGVCLMPSSTLEMDRA